MLKNYRNAHDDANAPTFEELTILLNPKDQNLFTWQNSEYWQIIKEALLKDKETINQASLKSGVQPRLLLLCNKTVNFLLCFFHVK